MNIRIEITSEIMEVENEVQSAQNDQNKAKTMLSGDEKAPDSSDNSPAKNRAGFSKGKKRKKPKDSTAPRQPLTGNVNTVCITLPINNTISSCLHSK